MSFLINKIYKFNTLAPSVLGETYDLMKVKSIMSAEVAVKHRDIHSLNKELHPVIPGLSNNANDNTYILFETKNGTSVVFAVEWLNINTVELVTSTNIRIDIPDGSVADMEVIKLTLLELGYNNIKIYEY